MGKRRLRSILLTFVPCYLFWLLLTMSLAPGELIAGAVICAAAAWFSSNFFVHSEHDAARMLNPWRMLKLLFYFVCIFLWEVLKSNWAMAKTVLLNRPIKQAIVRVPVRGITDDYALAILADCITLTPGTITMEAADGDEGVCLYVQWLSMETEDQEAAGEMIKGRMEKWIRRVWK